MSLHSDLQSVLKKFDENTKMGDLRKLAKEFKRDHVFAIELWSHGGFLPRMLAILIMDKKKLSQEIIDVLVNDIQSHPIEEQTQLIDWFMANQLNKDKATVALMESWHQSPSPLQRRLFWYHQARLRWTGKTDYSNTADLLDNIESQIEDEDPLVQWAMNFTAAQIGIFMPEYRSRCIALGERTQLYKDEVVTKNCTPNYLPDFINIQVKKLNN